MGITSAKKRGHNDPVIMTWPDLPGQIYLAILIRPDRKVSVMNAVLILVDSIISLYIYTLLAYVIASWLIAFKIINPWQPLVRWILQSLGGLHEPLLSRIRNVLPSLGGIDISPIIVLLAVQFLRNILFEYLG